MHFHKRLVLTSFIFFVCILVVLGTNTDAFTPSASGGGNGVSIERISPAADTDTAADWQGNASPSPGS